MKQRLLLLASLLPLMAQADIYQDPATKVYYEYTPGQKEAIVKGGDAVGKDTDYDGFEGVVNILPSFTIEGNEYIVTSIADRAFYTNKQMKGINIPSTVKTIGDHAFDGCYRLETIQLAEGLEKIGAWAFRECEKIKGFTIPSTLKEIGEYAFSNCESLESMYIPSSVQTIGLGIFDACSSLTTVTISQDFSMDAATLQA